ncbi:hypothetical protein [Thermospira aquatica]|uniref:GerMN domain-containing protein n=1 Tax=Thermospira aquatica TaxID=2828656 RepID=A0AAX3BCI8_9SPIR|nr:hypothetical protein [Thermospira aquatica]URA10004.1 hypothetical protein KDW03_11060 [Thermospira aquatica]
MKIQRKHLLWIVSMLGIVIVAGGVSLVLTAPPKVKMIYYSPKRQKIVDKQVLSVSAFKQYGRDAALVRQYFEGPLSYPPEIWFLDAKVKSVWVVPPKKPVHLVMNFSKDFLTDVQRHPLLVERWLEGLFATLGENGSPIEKCSILVEGSYERVLVGRWNLFYPIKVR